MSEFGDPKRGDGTAKFDAMVNRGTAQFLNQLTRASGILNRPRGSKVEGLPAQREEYQRTYKGNPQAHLQTLEQFQAQNGVLKGTLAYAKWVKSMERS